MATINKRGKSYVLNWVNQAGERQRKSLGKISKTEASTILHAKEIELNTGEDILIRNHFYLFSILADQYFNWHKFEYPDSHWRIDQITKQFLKPFFEGKPATIKPLEAEKYKVWRRAKVGIETVNKELRTLKAILNKGVEWDILSKHPLKSVKPIKNPNSAPPVYFTVEQLKEIYKTEFGAVWRLLSNTGLRRTEAQSLTISNVQTDRIRVLSTSKDRTKSGKWRDIPLSEGAIAAVVDLTANLKEGDPLIPKMTGSSLSRKFSKVLKKLNYDGSLHSLRHSFCSHLVMKGKPLRTVQILAGHANLKTTEKYAHLSPDHLQSSVADLNI